MRQRVLLAPLWGVLVLVLAACGPLPSVPVAPSTTPETAGGVALAGTSWVLTGYGPAGAPVTPAAESAPTLSVDESGNVSGKAGCNSYFGTLTLNGERASFSGLGRTLMACDGPIMTLEDGFLTALQAAETLGVEGGLLVITYDEGRGRLLFSPALQVSYLGSEWQLVGMAQGEAVSSVVAGSSITLTFEPGSSSVGGSAGCNRYSATVDAVDGRFEVGEIVTTRMACGAEIMEQEGAFLAALGAARSHTLQDDRLTLSGDGGQALLVFGAAR